MSKVYDRSFHLVLPNTHRTVLVPRPKPLTVRGRPLAMVLREHIDDLQVLALENPAVLQGLLDATKLAARQCRKYGVRR
jgi:hypothetical protein